MAAAIDQTRRGWSKVRYSPSTVLQVLAAPVLLLLCWELAVRLDFLPQTLIASPSQVAATLLSSTFALGLFTHISVSLLRLLAGFMIGTLLGVTFGTIVGLSRVGARLFEPTILSLIPIPPIAWIPLLIILLGIGDESKVALISVGSFSILFIHTSYGIRATDKNLVEVANVLGKSNMSKLRRILLPSALPGMLSSLRVAMAMSWTLLIASEVIASSKGLGWLIWSARNFSRPDEMIAGMVVVGILGKTTDWLLVLAERYLTRWRATYSDIADV